MDMLAKRLATLACALLLGACGTYYKIAGVPAGSTPDQVTATAGKPTDTWRDGAAEVWEYATGPAGAVTYLARFEGGRLSGVQQVLTEANFQKITPGTSKEDVRRLLGRPGQTATYANKGEEVWSWRYFEGTRRMLLNVHFDAAKGTVREVTRRVDEPGLAA